MLSKVLKTALSAIMLAAMTKAEVCDVGFSSPKEMQLLAETEIQASAQVPDGEPWPANKPTPH